jgi:mandelate racemase
LANGFEAAKLRIGYKTAVEDVVAVRTVREKMPSHTKLMVDFNQSLSVAEALNRCHAIADEGIYWVEEPIRHDDLAGYARLVKGITIPVQIGENFDGSKAMEAALEAGDCDFVMPDVSRIGGVTGWVEAAGVASARNVPLSSHVYPELSVHLLAAAPTAHFCEYVDWADPILAEPLKVINGVVTPSLKAGSGIEWNLDGVARYRIDRP